MKSCRGSSELIFVVLNFVTPEARYANDVNNRLKIRGWKNSWVENFVTRGIVTKITKISTPRKLPAIRYFIHQIFYPGDCGTTRAILTQERSMITACARTKARKRRETSFCACVTCTVIIVIVEHFHITCSLWFQVSGIRCSCVVCARVQYKDLCM